MLWLQKKNFKRESFLCERAYICNVPEPQRDNLGISRSPLGANNVLLNDLNRHLCGQLKLHFELKFNGTFIHT